MPGFTAINARTPEAPAPVADAAPEAAVYGPCKALKRRQPARKKPVAPKNGGQVTADATAPECISGKGKKRASRPGDEPEPKRRKSGSLKSSLPTTKTAVSATRTADPEENLNVKATSSSSTDAGLVSLTSIAKLNGLRYTRSQAAASGGEEPQSTKSMSISYVPETSMSSLHETLPQTTMQAVRNSSRGVSLLYSSSATYPSATQGVRATQVSIGPTPTLRPDPDRHITTKQGVRPTRASVGSTLTLGRDADRQITTQPSRGQLFTPVASHDPTEGNEHVSQPNFHHEIQNDPGDFGEPFDEEDEEIIELAERIEKSAQTAKSPPSRAHKLNIRDTHEHDDYGGALLSVEERKLLDAIKDPQDARKPIARAKFPPPIMDRSSLVGVSSTSALRTCFRIGEALNAGCQAVRNNRSLVLELYARVTSSWREPRPSRKQHFIINDLYHDKPPFINGTFDLWDQSALWEQDSRPFLQAGADGIICRMIARMKRDGTKWRLEILSIWKADWDDVEHVAGIYAKPGNEDGL